MTDDARPDAIPGSYLEQVIKQRDDARAALAVAEARIAASLAVVDRFDEYLLRRHAVADLRDALNGTGSAANGSS